MIIKIAYFIVYFIEMLISYIFFNHIGCRKKSAALTLAIGTVLFELGAVVGLFNIDSALLNAFFSLSANVVFAIVFFDVKKLQGIFYSFMLVVLSSFLELVSIFTISTFADIYILNYESQPMPLVIEVIISKIIYFLLIGILIKFVHPSPNSTSVRTPSSFYAYPISTFISVIFFWYIAANESISYRGQLTLAAISLLLFMASIFTFFVFQYNAKKDTEILLLQQESEKLKTDTLYYNMLERQNNNLSSYAHDTKNHLATIKALNHDPEIDMYISKMLDRLNEYGSVCHSGNHILDVIVDRYAAECALSNIDFRFDIKENNLRNLDYFDIVTILNNLFDNAVEAAKKSDNGYVSIVTNYRNNFSIIVITNSCSTQPEFNSSGELKTTKENPKLHGFGIKSVKNALKKYDGDLSLEYERESGEFIATVMLDARITSEQSKIPITSTK